jgi:hypothetical protein
VPDALTGQRSGGRSGVQYSSQDVENLAKLLKLPADNAGLLLDEVRRAAELYLHLQAGSGRTPKRAARLAALRRFQKALSKAEVTAGGVEFVLAATEAFDRFRSAAGSLQAIVDSLIGGKPAKGPESDFALGWLVRELAYLFHRYTGLPASTAWTVKRGYQGYSGPFLEFVKICTRPLNLGKKDVALGQSIRRALKQDKKAATSPASRPTTGG